MEKLYIVMPAYNEEANITNVVTAWYPLVQKISEDSRLVIADSGSTDSTDLILKNLQKEYPQLDIIRNTDRQHGPKVIALYNYAIKNGADYIFQTDSDGQTDPAEFDIFWNQREKYNGIFGNRTVRGDGQARAFVEKVVCLLLKAFFGVSVPDANAPFRLMKSTTLKKYLYRLPNEYSIPNIMLTTYFVYYGEKTKFINISFKPRQHGTNSINIRKIIMIGWSSLREFAIFRKELKKKYGEKNECE